MPPVYSSSPHQLRWGESLVEPSISIIIPCHNYGPFLAEAIESALAQTRPPAEVIVVDDGSTDDSAAVARRYARHPSLRLIVQENAGAIATYNTGVRASTGDYFVILSADDRLDLRYLERTVPLLQQHPQAGYVYTAYRLFGARRRVRTAPPFDAGLLARRPYITATALMRRAAFEDAGGFRGAMDGGHEDWDLFVSMAQRGWPGIALPEVLFHYRKHAGASRNSLPFTSWVRVRAHVYRGHRALYRIPLPLFLCLAVLDQNWLRLRAAPRAALRRLGPEGAQRARPPRLCLMVTEPGPHHRPRRHAASLARLAAVTMLDLATMAPATSAAGGSLRSPSGPGRDEDRPTGRTGRQAPGLQTLSGRIARAVYQRATHYQAHDLPSLVAGVVAALVNRASLLYDPGVLWPDRSRRAPARWLWRTLERVLLWRVDILIAADRQLAETLSRRYNLPATVLEDCSERLGAEACALEERRLLQLYRDLLGQA